MVIPYNIRYQNSEKKNFIIQVEIRQSEWVLLSVTVFTEGGNYILRSLNPHTVSNELFPDTTFYRGVLQSFLQSIKTASDTASAHFITLTHPLFDEQRTELVLKEKNPQNCPQASLVETLWQTLEEKVYPGGWEAKTVDQLKRRIKTKAREVDMTSA